MSSTIAAQPAARVSRPDAAQRGRVAQQICAALTAHTTAQARSKTRSEPAVAVAFDRERTAERVLHARAPKACGCACDAHHSDLPVLHDGHGVNTHRDPRQNNLLAALPTADLQRWLPLLEWIDLPQGHVLYESGVTSSHIYFPTTAIVSLLYVLENGASAESALVGREGLVGVSLFMGGGSTPSRAVVQSAGACLRMKASAIREEFGQSGAVMRLLLRYTQAMITQMAQTAVCNRHHLLDQQVSRWLLLSLDRLSGNDLKMTHELIANTLGVRREGVTEAALKLQKDGFIRYARGQIEILDRRGLEQRSCECYGVVKREYERLLPTPLP